MRKLNNFSETSNNFPKVTKPVGMRELFLAAKTAPRWWDGLLCKRGNSLLVEPGEWRPGDLWRGLLHWFEVGVKDLNSNTFKVFFWSVTL